MRRFAGVGLALLFLPSIGWTQGYSRLYTQPAIPAEETLARQNLKLAWRAYLPVDGRRDGLFSVHPLGDQILVQLRSGAVVALDAEKGTTQWRARVGLPYLVTQELGYNKRSVFVVNGLRLFALDRQTGRVQWEFNLPTAMRAAPVADEQRLYLCLVDDRLYIYDLPPEGLMGPPPPPPPPKEEIPPLLPGQPYHSRTLFARTIQGVNKFGTGSGMRDYNVTRGVEPKLVVFLDAHTRVDDPPILTPDLITLPGGSARSPRQVAGVAERAIVSDSVAKAAGYTYFYVTSRKAPGRFIPYRIDAPLTAPVAQHGDTVYLAERDANFYALDLAGARTLWRVPLTRALVVRKPEVTDDDVYLSPERGGMYRLQRRTGDALWNNPNAVQFVSHTQKRVFATDPHGRLLILDRNRGTLLGSVDASEFVVPISNEWNDRIFLGANDGLLICLRDRDLVAAQANKTVEKKADPAKPGAKPPDKGDVGAEKKDDKEMKKDEAEMKKDDKEMKKDDKEMKKDDKE
jgi:outer membrane protein assembly factor BamB